MLKIDFTHGGEKIAVAADIYDKKTKKLSCTCCLSPHSQANESFVSRVKESSRKNRMSFVFLFSRQSSRENYLILLSRVCHCHRTVVTARDKDVAFVKLKASTKTMLRLKDFALLGWSRRDA